MEGDPARHLAGTARQLSPDRLDDLLGGGDPGVGQRGIDVLALLGADTANEMPPHPGKDTGRDRMPLLFTK